VNEADVVFVLDSSGSIDADDFSQILDFVSRLVDNFDVEGGAIRVGVVTYADDVQSASTFNLNQYSTRQAVKVSAAAKEPIFLIYANYMQQWMPYRFLLMHIVR